MENNFVEREEKLKQIHVESFKKLWRFKNGFKWRKLITDGIIRQNNC